MVRAAKPPMTVANTGSVICPGGGWRLWVAIADVSYYVRPPTPLDREARNRGTSVYFPSQVVP
ncbi:RNB domain-containing ribonuclease, partial [Salmonella enterica subsp. enterica serovar Kentucky]|nr:RNB domain-containing ribonuclease [Salmonella enterica subsp. enterica serovar Kentucky]